CQARLAHVAPRCASLQMRCARHFLNFSWLPQKPILSRNSSLSGGTQKICGLSAWLREQKDGLLSYKARSIIGLRAMVARRRHAQDIRSCATRVAPSNASSEGREKNIADQR